MIYALVIAVFLPMQPVAVQVQYVESQKQCVEAYRAVARSYYRDNRETRFMARCLRMWEV